MAKKSILDQIESGERVWLILAASGRRDGYVGWRGADECRRLLERVLCMKQDLTPAAPLTQMPSCSNRSSASLAV